jgi:hypothetical protein
VLHQLGRGPRANFAIQRPEENAGRHEAVPSIIIIIIIEDGGLLKRAEGQLVQSMHEAARCREQGRGDRLPSVLGVWGQPHLTCLFVLNNSFSKLIFNLGLPQQKTQNHKTETAAQ